MFSDEGKKVRDGWVKLLSNCKNDEDLHKVLNSVTQTNLLANMFTSILNKHSKEEKVILDGGERQTAKSKKSKSKSKSKETLYELNVNCEFCKRPQKFILSKEEILHKKHKCLYCKKADSFNGIKIEDLKKYEYR